MAETGHWIPALAGVETESGVHLGAFQEPAEQVRHTIGMVDLVVEVDHKSGTKLRQVGCGVCRALHERNDFANRCIPPLLRAPFTALYTAILE